MKNARPKGKVNQAMDIHLLINIFVLELSAQQNRKLRNKSDLHAVVATASKRFLFANMSLNLSTSTQVHLFFTFRSVSIQKRTKR